MVADGFGEVGFHGVPEIVPNERLVSTEAAEGIPMPTRTRLDILHSHRGGRTHHDDDPRRASDEGGRDAHIESGMEAGMQDAMDLLEVAVSLS